MDRLHSMRVFSRVIDAGSFAGAARPELGREVFEETLRLARERHPLVQAGVFGADMQVHLVNDGPVTILLEAEAPR